MAIRITDGFPCTENALRRHVETLPAAGGVEEAVAAKGGELGTPIDAKRWAEMREPADRYGVSGLETRPTQDAGHRA